MTLLKTSIAFVFLAGAVAAQSLDITLSEDQPDLHDTLEEAALVHSLLDDPNATNSDFVAAAKADYRRMLRGLYGAGYYGGSVSIRIDDQEASGIAPHRIPSHIDQIAIAINLGPQFTFGQVQIAPRAALITAEMVAIASGQPARADALRDATQSALTAWRDTGHAKASIANENITANHQRHDINAAIDIAPGPKLRFGPLQAAGTHNMTPQRIRAISGLPVGEVFSPHQLELATQRLRRTGVFASVVLKEAEQWGADYSLPITAELQARKPRRIGFGAQYSSTEGAQISAYWLHRNLLGGGERFRAEARISGIGQAGNRPDGKISLQFDRPATWNPDNDLHLAFTAEHQNNPAYRFDELGLYAGISRTVHEDFKLDAGIGFLWGKAEDGFGVRHYQLATLPLSASLDRRDDRRVGGRDSKSGYYIALDATPFIGRGASQRGMRLTIDGRAYRSFSDQRLTFAARATASSLIGAHGDQVPADFLFYSGGGGSVRGQAYNSLGILNQNGTLTGGRSQLGLQAELRGKLTPKIGIVGFMDFGYVGQDQIPLTQWADNPNWHGGAGIGVRYSTPLGPIRLDLATPITGEDKFDRAQFYIGIGQAF